MTTMNKAAATKLVNELKANGAAFSAIKTTVRTMGYKDIDALLAELKVEKGNKKAILDSMYDYLAEKPRTEAEFKKWVEDNGSENTMRWIKTHDKARQLANSIHGKYTANK